ncbi:solute carrier family 23 protein [Gottschalkiaceae bacterium SANA]|nr:solute carrier family 23 protein [Gottschalkiaceae bacterium SANA]
MSTNEPAMTNSNYYEGLNGKNIVLGLQHLIAMFGATVLVPILTGLNPSVALFSAGVGTLTFHAVTGGKVPVFLGSSFAFIASIVAVGQTFGDLRYAQGGIMVAGLIYVLLSFLVKGVGVDKVRRLLPAQVVGPMIIVIGLNLVPVAYGMASGNFLLAGITLGSALLIKYVAKGFIQQLNILLAVVIGYVVSLSMGQVDTSLISDAAFLAMPSFTTPLFDIGAIMMIAPIVLAVFMEHIGDITTNGQVVGKNFIEDPGLNRTLLGDGLATLIAGLIGGPANTTYGENTGVLAITKNYNPATLRIAACFAIVLAFVGKLGGTLSSIPVPVMGGISLMLFTMIAYIGVQTIKREEVKVNAKNLIVMALILFIGLSPTYLGLTIGIPVTSSVSISGLSLAALVGVIANLALNGYKK